MRIHLHWRTWCLYFTVLVVKNVCIAQDQSYGCLQYTVLQDNWRNVSLPKTTTFCDRSFLSAGIWYRMIPPAGSRIPEKAPPINSCGTSAPMWLNGLHPTVVSSTPVERQLCANWNGNTCLWSTYVQVALCNGGYYVYMAPVTPTPTCDLAWCAEYVEIKMNSIKTASFSSASTGTPCTGTLLSSQVTRSVIECSSACAASSNCMEACISISATQGLRCQLTNGIGVSSSSRTGYKVLQKL